jgi:ParB/RepB/Spo0J family partition protein
MSKEVLPFDRIVEEIKARPGNLSERGVCAGAGLDASALAVARRNGRKLALPTIEKLCAWLQKPVSWALGETPAPAIAGETPDGFLSYNQIIRSDLNPRKDFGELTDSSDTSDPGLPELANSIAENGVLQNLLVRPMREDDWRPVGAPATAAYVIVFGERRWRAIGILVKEARWDPDAPKIPANIRQMSDDEHVSLAILENLQRKNMNPMEEAEAFAKLQKLDKVKWSPAEIAKKIGVTPRLVQQRLQLVKDLDKPAKDALRAGDISVREARVIVQAAPERRKELLQAATETTAEGELKEKLLDKCIEAKHALFVFEGDGAVDAGPMITDDDGALYFASKKAFMREQRKAARAKAIEFKKEHGLGFIECVEDFNDYWYEKATGESGGVYYTIHPYHGDAKFYAGWKKKVQRTYSHSSSGHKTAEQKAREQLASRRRNANITFLKGLAVAAAKDPMLAVRISLLTLVVDCEAENLPFSRGGCFDLSYGQRLDFDLPAKLAALCGKDGKVKDNVERAALWKVILGLTDNQAAAMLAAAIAGCVDRPNQWSQPPGMKKDFGPDSLVGILAAALNVEVPEVLLPAAKKKAAE